MTGNEFLDRLKRLDPRKELKKGTLSSMCRNLGIKPQDLY